MRARTVAFSLVSGAFLLISAAAAQTAAVPGTMPPLPPAQPPVTLTPPPGVAAPVPIAGPAQHYRGTIAELNGPFLTLKTADKKTVTLGVTMQTRVIHNRMLKLTDLQAGTWILVAVLRGADGKLRAQSVRVYPASLRGQGEGEYQADPANPMRLVVGGAVTTVTPGGIGGAFTVAFHGTGADATGACMGHAVAAGCDGAAEIQYARGVPIVAPETGDVSLLALGATVSASAAADANGTLVAATVTIERDAPPPKP